MLLAGDVIFAAGAGPAPAKIVTRSMSVHDRCYSRCRFRTAHSWLSELAAAPVFNGMAAAGGELFLALEDGQLICMTGEWRNVGSES